MGVAEAEAVEVVEDWDSVEVVVEVKDEKGSFGRGVVGCTGEGVVGLAGPLWKRSSVSSYLAL